MVRALRGAAVRVPGGSGIIHERTMRTRPVCTLIVALCALLLAQSAQPQGSDLDRVRSEIRQLRQRLEQVRGEAQTVARELEAVELDLAIRTRELEVAHQAEAVLEARQGATVAQIDELLLQIERQRGDLKKRLVALYRLGGLSYLRLLLSLEQEGSPFEAISMLNYVVSRDARTVSRFQASHDQLSLRQTELADQRLRLQELVAGIEANRNAIAEARAEKERLLAKLQSEEQGAARQLAELEEKARRLQRLIETLSLQKQGIDPEIDVRTVQGALPWPVSGKVIERFGRQRSPKFATWTINNGIKVEAAPGSEVRAVFQGTVLYSQWFKGYGNLIILDHGNRVFSLYGNLKAPVVTVGDRIASGQTIAGAGESEEGSAGYLYFEIRHDNKPEDPRKWLR
jgi:murein hydrolase activator